MQGDRRGEKYRVRAHRNGYFDMVAYQKFNDGEMADYVPTDEELAKSIASLPKVN